jgi:hypothetical protein
MPWFGRQKPPEPEPLPNPDERIIVFYEIGDLRYHWERYEVYARLARTGQTAMIFDTKTERYELWSLGEQLYEGTDSLYIQRRLREIGQPHLEGWPRERK